MTTKKKLLKKFLEKPESLNFRQIERLLKWFGFERIRVTGSHFRFRHREYDLEFPVPVHDRDCKKWYKKYISDIFKNNFLI